MRCGDWVWFATRLQSLVLLINDPESGHYLGVIKLVTVTASDSGQIVAAQAAMRHTYRMPIRPRSHILEKLSISRFADALPDGWVYRIKTPDYGIDGEVEIFDERGRSTGLSFNVQLRATDDANRADRVKLELDELDYYQSLDLPTAVVRYGSPNNSIFWEWGANIASRLKTNEGQKTTTYRFNSGDLWSETTPAKIWRTLEVRRSLANFSTNRPVPSGLIYLRSRRRADTKSTEQLRAQSRIATAR